MNEFQIETAQNVTIEQNVAPIMDRMWAYLIDSLVIGLYFFFCILLLIGIGIDIQDAWSIYLIVSLPGFLYYVLLETFWDGQTVGKKLLQTKVVKLDGSKPGFSNYFIRWIIRIVDVVLSSCGLALIVILIKGNGQRLGDIAAGTTVISLKQKVTLKDTLIRDIALDYVPKYSQVTLFNDSDMQTIKTVYEEAKRLDDHNVILSLYKRVITVMEVEPLETPIEFLNTVIKDYNYYTQNM